MLQQPLRCLVALDTSTPNASAAAWFDHAVGWAAADPLVPISAQLPKLILDLLDAEGIALTTVDVFAVASGPGGFTGLRFGIATVQGLALALDRPVVAIPTLEALAAASLTSRPARSRELRTIIMSGQRREVFVAQYLCEGDGQAFARPALEAGPLVCTADALRENALPGFRPPAARVWRGHQGAGASGDPIGGDGIWTVVDFALAPVIATLGRLVAASGGATVPHGVRPVYVRRPDAEIARERARTSGALTPSDGA